MTLLDDYDTTALRFRILERLSIMKILGYRKGVSKTENLDTVERYSLKSCKKEDPRVTYYFFPNSVVLILQGFVLHFSHNFPRKFHHNGDIAK